MTDKQIMIDGVDVNEWTDEEVRYKFEKRSPKAIRQIAFDLYKQLKRKEQECQQAMDNYVQLDLQRVKEYNELVDLYKAKEQECEELKEALAEIKEIAECCQTPANCKDYCQFYNECIDGGLPLILQKISEVENEN